MARWIKVPTAKTDDKSLIPETHLIKVRTDSQLSSEFHCMSGSLFDFLLGCNHLLFLTYTLTGSVYPLLVTVYLSPNALLKPSLHSLATIIETLSPLKPQSEH